MPAPTAERPPTIRNLADLPLNEGRDGRLAYATRDMRDMGSGGLVLAQDAMPPDTHNTDLHFHSAREEAWFVRGGSGIARLGDDGPRAASRLVLAARTRTPASGTGSRSARRAWTWSRWAT